MRPSYSCRTNLDDARSHVAMELVLAWIALAGSTEIFCSSSLELWPAEYPTNQKP